VKLKALALALFVAGVSTSFAVADDGGHGKGRNDETTTAATGTTTGKHSVHPAKEHRAKKVTLCHKASHPPRWVKISVSRNAVRAHTRRGDVAPDSTGNCPAPAAGAAVTTTTTTTSTTP
jgi:hypothetical protein